MLSGVSFGLSGKDYLEKINANYHALKSFELQLSYVLYKGHQGVEVKDEYRSVLKMNGRRSYRKVYSEEIITAEQISLVLNHELKTIQILPGLKTEIFNQDITTSLEQCKAIKVTQSEEGTKISITFKDFSSVQYAKIDIVIDDNYWVKHMTLFYATEMNYSSDYFHPEMDYPRLEVDYELSKGQWKDNDGLTELSKYVIKEGNLYKATELYQNYEILQ